MQMAARVSENVYESIGAAPAVQAVVGAPLSGVEFFGARDEGMLLQFGGSRLEIMAGTPIQASLRGNPVGPDELHAALYSASGSPVSGLAVERGRRLTIEFAAGLVLTVSLKPQERAGLESAAYYDEAWRYEAY